MFRILRGNPKKGPVQTIEVHEHDGDDDDWKSQPDTRDTIGLPSPCRPHRTPDNCHIIQHPTNQNNAWSLHGSPVFGLLYRILHVKLAQLKKGTTITMETMLYDI